MKNIADITEKMSRDLQETRDQVDKANEEQYHEDLRRHNEIVSELQNIAAAVKELTDLIRNTG